MARSALNAGMLCALLCGMSPIAVAQTAVDTARAHGLSYLIKQQNGDGSWKSASGLEVAAAANAVDALHRAGMQKAPQYAAGLAWLANAAPGSVDAQSRRIATLSRGGVAVSSAVAELAKAQTASTRASFGSYIGHGFGVADTALALQALRVANPDNTVYPNRSSKVLNTVFCDVLPTQLADRSFPYMPRRTNESALNQTGALLPTALAILELDAARVAFGVDTASCGSTFTISTAVNNARTWLLGRQKADGGFGDGANSNVIATAIVYSALAAMPSPPEPATTNARNYLVSQRNASNGSWNNDPFVTGLVLAALPAPSGALADPDNDGIPSVVENHLNTNPSVADSRTTIAPGGNSTPGATTPGITSSTFVQTATLGVPFSFTVPPVSTPGPYQYEQSTGDLPPGLSFNQSTGLISGTPTVRGLYAFDYIVSNTQGQPLAVLIGRIDVVDPVAEAPNGDVPLPFWAIAMLGSLLGGSLYRFGRRGTRID